MSDTFKIKIFDQTLREFVQNIKKELISWLKDQLALAFADFPARLPIRLRLPNSTTIHFFFLFFLRYED
jgi:hypothetical protein